MIPLGSGRTPAGRRSGHQERWPPGVRVEAIARAPSAGTWCRRTAPGASPAAETPCRDVRAPPRSRVVLPVEELLAGARPRGVDAPAGRDLPLSTRARKGPHVDLGDTCLVRLVGEPAPVGGEGRIGFDGRLFRKATVPGRHPDVSSPSRGRIMTSLYVSRMLLGEGKVLPARMPRRRAIADSCFPSAAAPRPSRRRAASRDWTSPCWPGRSRRLCGGRPASRPATGPRRCRRSGATASRVAMS